MKMIHRNGMMPTSHISAYQSAYCQAAQRPKPESVPWHLPSCIYISSFIYSFLFYHKPYQRQDLSHWRMNLIISLSISVQIYDRMVEITITRWSIPNLSRLSVFISKNQMLAGGQCQARLLPCSMVHPCLVDVAWCSTVCVRVLWMYWEIILLIVVVLWRINVS